MNAVPVQAVSVAQNTPEWLALRRRYRTASETPAVMGLSPWQTREQLAAQKWNGAANEGSAATQHGHDHEQEARAAFEAKTGMAFPPAVVVRGEYLASLDGWNIVTKDILEIKCPFSGQSGRTWQSALWGRVEPHYYAQVQHQLMVSGAAAAHFWVWDTAGRAGIEVAVAPDAAWQAEIRRWWDWFCERHQPKGNKQ